VCQRKRPTTGPQPYVCGGVSAEGAQDDRWPVPHAGVILTCVECLRDPLTAFKRPWSPREEADGTPAVPWGVGPEDEVADEARGLVRAWDAAGKLHVLAQWMESEAVQVLVEAHGESADVADRRARRLLLMVELLPADGAQRYLPEYLQSVAAGAAAACAAAGKVVGEAAQTVAWQLVDAAVQVAWEAKERDTTEQDVPALLLWASAGLCGAKDAVVRHLLTVRGERTVQTVSPARVSLLVRMSGEVRTSLGAPRRVLANCRALMASIAPAADRVRDVDETPDPSPTARALADGRVAMRHAQTGEWASAAAAYGAAAEHVRGTADGYARRIAGELLTRQAHCFIMVHDLVGAAKAARAAMQADALRFDAAMHLAWTVLCAGEVDKGVAMMDLARERAVDDDATEAVRIADTYADAVEALMQHIDEVEKEKM